MKLVASILITAAALGSAGAAQALCVGTCGTLGPDGVVTSSPLGGTYQYVSTSGGLPGVGSLGVGGETNGSLFTTASFTAAAGDALVFYFNFVTSDGAGFSDYAFSQLNGPGGGVIFTARTTPTGDTVPGFGLPGLASVLTPSTTPIIGGAPVWSALGGDSGRCFDAGCGYTGWIKSDYTITTAGNYSLSFGVTNNQDTLFQTGLAFDGITIAGVPVTGTPEPETWAMMLVGFGAIGALMRRRVSTVTFA